MILAICSHTLTATDLQIQHLTHRHKQPTRCERTQQLKPQAEQVFQAFSYQGKGN